MAKSFLIEALTKVSENQVNNEIQVQQFTKQIKSHLRLIQEYRRENKHERKKREREILETKSKEQRKLSKWLS